MDFQKEKYINLTSIQGRAPKKRSLRNLGIRNASWYSGWTL